MQRRVTHEREFYFLGTLGLHPHEMLITHVAGAERPRSFRRHCSMVQACLGTSFRLFRGRVPKP